MVRDGHTGVSLSFPCASPPSLSLMSVRVTVHPLSVLPLTISSSTYPPFLEVCSLNTSLILLLSGGLIKVMNIHQVRVDKVSEDWLLSTGKQAE